MSFKSMLKDVYSVRNKSDTVNNKIDNQRSVEDSPNYQRVAQLRTDFAEQLHDALKCEYPSLGVLLIIIDSLPNEVLWRLWSENNLKNEDKKGEIRFWIHAKYPNKVQSAWVKSRLVHSFHLIPEWGSLELAKVMIKMLEEAVTEAPNTHAFCFASESCLPIISKEKMFNSVYSLENTINDKISDKPQYYCRGSWVKYKSQPSNGYAKQLQFEVLLKELPEDCVYKADQWVLLARKHALEILDLIRNFDAEDSRNKKNSRERDSSYFSIFRNVKASDEMFIPTSLAVLQRIPSVNDGNMKDYDLKSIPVVMQQRLTYADWSDNGNSPKSYKDFPKNEICLAVSESCAFFRKYQLPSVSPSIQKVNESSSNIDQLNQKKIQNVQSIISDWIKLVWAVETDPFVQSHVSQMEMIQYSIEPPVMESKSDQNVNKTISELEKQYHSDLEEAAKKIMQGMIHNKISQGYSNEREEVNDKRMKNG